MLSRKQIQTVLFFEVTLIVGFILLSYSFWSSMCPDQGWSTCLKDQPYAPWTFLLFSLIRPFVATPVFMMSIMAGGAFGVWGGTLISALGQLLATVAIYFPAKFMGNIFVKPFFTFNMPAFWKLIRTQDYKIIAFLRLVPVLPFDLITLLFGVVNFRTRSVIILTFLASIPQSYIFASLGAGGSTLSFTWALKIMGLALIVVFSTLFIYEILSRKKGKSFWFRMKYAYLELIYELRSNNQLFKADATIIQPSEKPVLVLYGFFSSRRSVAVLHRYLEQKGRKVISLDLGGLFGVFFTKGIKESASIVADRLHRSMEENGYQKFDIVAHSKGGLVGLYYVMKLGGHAHVDKVITMATPFRGSFFVYLLLFTPVGFFWKDIWQMRPGSEFLDLLHKLPIPQHLKIYCFYSKDDRVSRGNLAVFRPQQSPDLPIKEIPIANCKHVEFMHRRDIGEMIHELLKEEHHHDASRVSAYSS